MSLLPVLGGLGLFTFSWKSNLPETCNERGLSEHEVSSGTSKSQFTCCKHTHSGDKKCNLVVLGREGGAREENVGTISKGLMKGVSRLGSAVPIINSWFLYFVWGNIMRHYSRGGTWPTFLELSWSSLSLFFVEIFCYSSSLCLYPLKLLK